MMFFSESARLLPRLSGIISVLSSTMRTKPARSPRGEQSSPSGPLVASATKGDASMKAAYSGITWSSSLTTEASPGRP